MPSGSLAMATGRPLDPRTTWPEALRWRFRVGSLSGEFQPALEELRVAAEIG
jgi:hypothetical protein